VPGLRLFVVIAVAVVPLLQGCASAPGAGTAVAARPEPARLSPEAAASAQGNYVRYCALCHGDDRQGHVNDHAPSLRSRSLIESGSPWYMGMTTWYGRPGTPMGGYLDEVGGPMSRSEIRDMMIWLQMASGYAPVAALTRDQRRIDGDERAGAQVYARHCAVCHGVDGSGVTGTALGNQAMLSMTPDAFLRHAIAEGRQDTPMPAFASVLTADEIDAVTAFLRSRSGGWEADRVALHAPPDPSDYVLNPGGRAPQVSLREGMYVSAADLHRALEDRSRLVLLDTRVTSMWQKGHIAGAVPIPYYSSRDEVLRNLPRDGTLIVAYCECPRAAAETVLSILREQGIENSAVLWEGIGGWITLGYPVVQGSGGVTRNEVDQGVIH